MYRHVLAGSEVGSVCCISNEFDRMAKMPSCAYWKDEYHQVANFDYRIDHLKEFRYIIEDLNGISYR